MLPPHSALGSPHRCLPHPDAPHPDPHGPTRFAAPTLSSAYASAASSFLLSLLSCPSLLESLFLMNSAPRGPVAIRQHNLSNGVSPLLFEAVATNYTIAKTRAILMYGQGRASVMPAIACR